MLSPHGDNQESNISLSKDVKDVVSSVISSQKRFGEFLQQGKYTDYVVIDANGEYHKVHKVILACHSEYFEAVFSSNFRESAAHSSRLSFPDPRRMFKELIQYMYTLEISVGPNSIVALLQQAEYYQMMELVALLNTQIETVYLPKHVLPILRDGVETKLANVIDLASGVLAENFDAIEWEDVEHDLNFLPVDVLLGILGNRALTLDTEYRVYKVISNYVQDWQSTPKVTQAHTPSMKRPLSAEDCKQLFSHVYFEHLTLEQQEEAFENPNVPKELLCGGLLITLRMALGKPVNQERLGRMYTKHMHTKRGRDFAYSGTDFDKNGVIYWLGTQLDESSFKNPHETGHIACLMSSVQSGSPANLVSRQSIPTCTMSEKDAFILVDFGPSNFVLKPTAYTLRHGFYRDNVNLRRWKFEASNDGENWNTISIHDREEDSLGGEYGTRTFEVTCEKWYRLFRVVSMSKFFVQICGIEFYGNLLPKTLDAAVKRKNNIFAGSAEEGLPTPSAVSTPLITRRH